MDKVITVEDILAYKEAAKTLENYDIDFDKKKLLDNPELCHDIIRLMKYFSKK
jgi:hypothetical protein